MFEETERMHTLISSSLGVFLWFSSVWGKQEMVLGCGRSCSALSSAIPWAVTAHQGDRTSCALSSARGNEAGGPLGPPRHLQLRLGVVRRGFGVVSIPLLKVLQNPRVVWMRRVLKAHPWAGTAGTTPGCSQPGIPPFVPLGDILEGHSCDRHWRGAGATSSLSPDVYWFSYFVLHFLYCSFHAAFFVLHFSYLFPPPQFESHSSTELSIHELADGSLLLLLLCRFPWFWLAINVTWRKNEWWAKSRGRT